MVAKAKTERKTSALMSGIVGLFEDKIQSTGLAGF
jgi:hypothetical protein